MTTPIGTRLKYEMKRRGVTSSELARRADVKTSFIYDVISGKSANPSTVKLARVAESLGVSLMDLVEDATSTAKTKITSRPRSDDYVTIPRIMVDVSAKETKIITTVQEDEPHCFRAAWIRDHLGVSPDELRMLSVRGDSMEPSLYHNDSVLIDITKTLPSPPGIFVLYDGFGIVVKRLEYTQHKPPRIRVISDNPYYSDYDRSPEEAAIIGRVVWFARET